LKEVMKKYRVFFFFMLSLIILSSCALVVIGYAASRTVICQNCQGPNHDVMDATFSELMLTPEKYADQLIRLEAMFVHDAGFTFLRNPFNTSWEKSLHTGFGKDFIACAVTQKALTFHTGLDTWYDGEIQVTVIGKYGIIEDQRNFQTGRKGFTILCLEQVKPADTEKEISINTIRYSLGQLGKYVLQP
jgi:hypothetical protein